MPEPPSDKPPYMGLEEKIGTVLIAYRALIQAGRIPGQPHRIELTEFLFEQLWELDGLVQKTYPPQSAAIDRAAQGLLAQALQAQADVNPNETRN